MTKDMQDMQDMQERILQKLKTGRPRRFSPGRIGCMAAAILVILQVITVIALQAISAIRRQKRQNQNDGFPHPHLNQVIVGGNTLHIYDYGQDLYEAMIAAIDAAKEEIYLETFIWKDDGVGRRFKEHLERKAAEGVRVYVIFDGFGNLVVPRAFKKFSSDVQVLKYWAINRPWHVVDIRRYALDHRKLLVVDGYTAFIGGYNIGSLYATMWRDTHLCIKGETATDVAQSFIEFWNRNKSAAKRITTHYERHFDPTINIRGTNAMRLTFPIRDMYLEAIDRAEHCIRLTNAYFVPDHSLIEALVEACRRGVDVRILVPWVSNHVVTDWLSRGNFTECLKAGIRIFGYKNMLHAKTCTIDGEWSTIGTANLDRLSSVGNYEINVEIYSRDVAKEMETLFDCDTTNAFELKPQRWFNRPWYAMLGERILAPLRIMM
jgi:cardiolipin synthase